MDDGFDLPRELLEELAQLAVAADTRGWYELEALRDSYYAAQRAAEESAVASAAAAALAPADSPDVAVASPASGLGLQHRRGSGSESLALSPCTLSAMVDETSSSSSSHGTSLGRSTEPPPLLLHERYMLRTASAPPESSSSSSSMSFGGMLPSAATGSASTADTAPSAAWQRVAALKRSLEDEGAGPEAQEGWRGKHRRYQSASIVATRDTPHRRMPSA